MATKFSPARSHARRMSTPGPGAYELRQKIGDSPSFSFKSRTFVKSRAQTPPPGSYNPNFTLVSNGRYTNIGFGKRTPTRETGSDTPGPGTYDLVQITSYDKNSTISSKPKSAKRALSLDLSSIIKST